MHTHKTHKNMKRETIIHKQVRSKVNNNQTEHYETKHLKKEIFNVSEVFELFFYFLGDDLTV